MSVADIRRGFIALRWWNLGLAFFVLMAVAAVSVSDWSNMLDWASVAIVWVCFADLVGIIERHRARIRDLERELTYYR
ncbi:MAG: hypothetical protein MUP76_09795 [Acidimicrobiia bacterium]|nr:hypothetical protein [Acidimicrobiia bacterium]